MEIVIIALLAVLVIGAVALPLFRGRGDAADAHEFAGAPAAPALAEPGAPVAEDADAAAGAGGRSEIEAEVARYRTAIVAGTLCRRCGQANVRDARFCLECGKPLSVNDAQEFAT